MKQKIFNPFSLLLGAFCCSMMISGCKYDTKSLEPAPDADFTVTPVAGQTNRYVLSSNATGVHRFQWDRGLGAGYVWGKNTDTVYFADAGNYTVKMIAFGQGGFDTASKVINVAADDPAALTPLKILTGNSSKKWKLAPEVGALWIGPSDNSTTWWQNTMGDVTARSCQWNDEYTFSKNGNTLAFDSKGDFYVDEEAGQPHPVGMPAVGCYANSAIPAQFQAWAMNGNFTFDIIGNNKLKLNGTGAHLGVYKAANPPDAATTTPKSTITYDIITLTPTRLVVRLDYGWGAWRFTYVPA